MEFEGYKPSDEPGHVYVPVSSGYNPYIIVLGLSLMCLLVSLLTAQFIFYQYYWLSEHELGYLNNVMDPLIRPLSLPNIVARGGIQSLSNYEQGQMFVEHITPAIIRSPEIAHG